MLRSGEHLHKDEARGGRDRPSARCLHRPRPNNQSSLGWAQTLLRGGGDSIVTRIVHNASSSQTLPPGSTVRGRQNPRPRGVERVPQETIAQEACTRGRSCRLPITPPADTGPSFSLAGQAALPKGWMQKSLLNARMNEPNH